MRKAPIKSWDELKREMRERFIPCFYKITKNVSKSKSVEKYFNNMETQKAIIVRFFHDLNKDIQDIVQLHEYTSLSVLVHQASKVELQLKRHGKRTHPTISSNWKGKERRKNNLLNMDKSPKKGSTPFKGHKDEVIKVSIPNPNTSKSSNIDVLKNGDIESESSQEETSTSGSEGGCYSREEAPYEGDLLLVRRLMSTFVGEDQSQRQNIFRSRCLIQSKYCSLIIDGGSSVNIASQRLVDKFYIPIILYPKFYKLQWLSEVGEIIMDKNVSFAITLDKYKGEILCDVVPMEVTHVLLGRPWKHDRKVTHDGVTKKFSFMHGGNKVNLKLLTPKEVLEDQIKMKQKIAEEKKEKEKERKSGEKTVRKLKKRK
ncbi:hypothetical protein CR513_28117, partial [Mucuna pruriens]